MALAFSKRLSCQARRSLGREFVAECDLGGVNLAALPRTEALQQLGQRWR
jgi:hypothetical protein